MITPQLESAPVPKRFGRIEKPCLTTSIVAGMTSPMIMTVIAPRPWRPHDAVARAGPGSADFGTCQFHTALPPFAVAGRRPFWLAPFLYLKVSEQRVPFGTLASIFIGLPATARFGPRTQLAAAPSTAAPALPANARTSRAVASKRRRAVTVVELLGLGA
jgi:hypothetical protein